MNGTRPAFASLVVLLAVACGRNESPQPQGTSQTPGQAGGTLLVTELPLGSDGIELRGKAVAVSDGYELIPGSEGSFQIARKSDGEHVLSGGCGCTGGTCDPKLKDGIMVCEGSNCTGTCGLAVTLEGARVELVKF